MKINRLTLLVISFGIGTGGAVASSVYLADVYVKARLMQNGRIQCVNTLKQCQSNGTNICTVQIPTTANSGVTTATTSGPYRTYSTDCVFILSNTSDVALISDVQMYELISDYW